MNNQVIGNIILEASSAPIDVKLIAENGGKVEGTGIIQDADVENRNGRIYEEKDLKPEVYSDRIQKELIPTGNMRGHDGHPSSSELSIQSVIDPKLCSVQFTKIWMEGKDIHANFRGTNNEHGKAFNLDLLEGSKPSFSLRALGSVDRERNGKCYVRNLRIITWDRVIFPSHKRAYMTGFVNVKNEGALTESANLGYGETDLNSTAVLENGILIPVVNQQVVDYIKTESANVKSILANFETLYESAIIVNGGKNVQLQLATGEKMLINLEQYISDEIMNYCWGGADNYFNEVEVKPASSTRAKKSTTTSSPSSNSVEQRLNKISNQIYFLGDKLNVNRADLDNVSDSSSTPTAQPEAPQDQQQPEAAAEATPKKTSGKKAAQPEAPQDQQQPEAAAEATPKKTRGKKADTQPSQQQNVDNDRESNAKQYCNPQLGFSIDSEGDTGVFAPKTTQFNQQWLDNVVKQLDSLKDVMVGNKYDRARTELTRQGIDFSNEDEADKIHKCIFKRIFFGAIKRENLGKLDSFLKNIGYECLDVKPGALVDNVLMYFEGDGLLEIKSSNSNENGTPVIYDVTRQPYVIQFDICDYQHICEGNARYIRK